MKIVKITVLIALILCLNGCERKIMIKNKIPSALLQIPKIDTNRTITQDKEVGLLMLDLFEAYEKCALNLKSIKRLNDEW